jgi:PAS domain S-box-containing protein
VVRGLQRWRVNLEHAVSERKQAEQALRRAHDELEVRVEQRTAELGRTNQALQAEITERLQAEMASTRLAAIVESSDDAIISKNLNSIITSWNRGAEKIFGYTASDMVGTSIMRLIPTDRQDEEKQIQEKIKCGESVNHFETLRQTKDGRLIDVSATTSPIKDATGKVIGLSKVARDITERKRAEEALRASQQIIEGIINAIPVRVFWKDKNLVYLGCNAVFARDAGFTDPKDIIGKDDYQMGWRDQADFHRRTPDDTRGEHHHASFEQATSAQFQGGDQRRARNVYGHHRAQTS